MELGSGSLESLGMNGEFWSQRRVFVTGHTGFKGSWLSLWLQEVGAKVHGFAMPPPTEPNLFTVAGIQAGMAGHTVGDIRDLALLTDAMRSARPEIVLHLAAQPLVRYSYANPLETHSVNVLGTVNLMEAMRAVETVRVAINVTTDKCYENREWFWGYRENEPLGGRDPYSSSKACSELITASYRDSFFDASGLSVSTARAGNVVGGGDWAVDRLLPDVFRAVLNGQVLKVRHPEATRPWQHVLEPLSGYLLLAERMYAGGRPVAGAWNFGPRNEDARSVRWVLDYLSSKLPSVKWSPLEDNQSHEANYLKLDISKASVQLGWEPRWHLACALDKTLEWYTAWSRGLDVRALSLAQIHAYQSADLG